MRKSLTEQILTIFRSKNLVSGRSIREIIILVILLVIGCYLLSQRARQTKPNKLPVHLAILKGQRDASLIQVLKEDRTIIELDSDGRTAFDCVLSCLETDPSFPISSEFLAELLLMSLSSIPKIDSKSRFDDWLSAVQSSHEVVVEAVLLVLDHERGQVEELANAKDSTGLLCRDLMSTECRKEIKKRGIESKLWYFFKQ